MSKISLFAEAQSALFGGTQVELYGNNPVTEMEVAEAYAECLHAALPVESQIVQLFAEAENYLATHENDYVGTMIFAEAEGGFFKKIIALLIKVYNKAKDFIVKLLGRFKSDKAYRTDLVYIKDIANGLKNVTFNDNASIQMRKSKYGTLINFVVGALSTSQGELSAGQFPGGVTLKALNQDMKDIIKAFAKNSAEGNVSGKMDAFTKNLQAVSGKYAAADAWTKELIGAIISKGKAPEDVATGLGDAQFTPTSSQSASEAMAKLWDDSKQTLKGNDIKIAITNLDFFANSIKYDDMSKAIEEGVATFTEQIKDLQSSMSEAENAARAAQGSTNTGDEVRALAGKVGTVSTQYSKTLTMYSTVVTTTFNLAKTVLDKLIRDFKELANALDALRKASGSTSSPTPVEDGNDTKKNKK